MRYAGNRRYGPLRLSIQGVCSVETKEFVVVLELTATFQVEVPSGRSAEVQLTDFIEPALEDLKENSPEFTGYTYTVRNYPGCPFQEQCNAQGIPSGENEGYCECPRGTIRYMESTGASHEVAVSVAAIHVALEIRQHGFDGHDEAFQEFNEKFINNGWSNDGKEYTTWVQENQPAVQWALDFAGLREFR